jgi:predicted O-methyltransferase YrrM
MLEWKSDTRLVVGGTDFALSPTKVMSGRAEALATGALLLRKPRWMVERYAALQPRLTAANVFELGIFDGGSTALLAQLFRPRHLVAVDIEPDRVALLDAFIDAHGLSDSVHAYYGVDQADRARLEEIVTTEFGSEPLDLVIDDASHLLPETTASFNVLFPRLRPGGLFVLEDWSWQHFRDEAVIEKLLTDDHAREALTRRLEAGDSAPTQDPLSRLVLQLVLTAAYAEDVVAEVTSVRRGWLVVRRGKAKLDPDEFDIARCYGSLGRSVLREP